MIFVLAADRLDATQWASFQGHDGSDWRYVHSRASMEGRRLSPVDRIVRTARHMEHPDVYGIERVIDYNLTVAGLTESVHGGLVRQSA